jgi:hypothetical protein
MMRGGWFVDWRERREGRRGRREERGKSKVDIPSSKALLIGQTFGARAVAIT